MFGTWDLVRPRHWHPMASLEQSMMEDMDLMLRPPIMRFPSLFHDDTDDDEFFSDLPVRGRGGRNNATKSSTDATHPQQDTTGAQDQQPQSEHGDDNKHTFSTYSFSNSSIVDDKGRRVVSTRRRYEDSTGRLKALHERQIEGQTMRAVWNRQHKGDEGQHEQICSSGTSEEFETAWKQTPFGVAHEQHAQIQPQKEQQAIKDKGDAKTMEPAAKAS